VLSDDVHGDEAALTTAVREVAGAASIASTSDFTEGALDVEQALAADAAVFPELGLAVVSADPAQAAALSASARADGRILAVEPEQTLYAITESPGLSTDFLHGYREAANHLYELASGEGAGAAVELAGFSDTAAFTWGLQATGVSTSSWDGRGVAVAILDTGFDLAHPDFAGRAITAQSFVPGEPPQDGHGHGTHTAGTACGSATPSVGRRYGVATAADIFIGKVLNNQGSGTDTTILAGMSWAIANNARVVSMSLGADVRSVSVRYERAGSRALAAGTLIVAAAGNNAHRQFGDPGFVGTPANSPSIMAVGAVDAQSDTAVFSARSNPVPGGQVDIAGPGVAVYSSWPMSRRYNTISGTSMATPHVAGIAALWHQATGATGAALWTAVIQAAQRLPLASVDVGTGLAQAPQ
jgi:subtilisin family serine protease